MRILQALNLFSPHGGGVPDVVYHLSKTLIQRGHEVTVYSSDYKLDPEYTNPLKGANIRLFHCWSHSFGFYLMPGMISTIRRSLKEFDIIHLHTQRSFQNIVIHHYAKKFGIPYVLQAHGSATTYFQRGIFKRIFDVLWGNNILRDSVKIIALTPIEVEQYESLGAKKDRIEIIPNGIDHIEFKNLPPRGEFRKRHGLLDNEKIVLYLGRIHQVKGIDLLVKAFSSLPQNFDKVRLIILGPDHGYLSTLRSLTKELNIDDKVLFAGPLYGRERLRAYVDAEVYVLPSVYEIFGITVLEALACGTPVIVTDRCGIADVIHGQTGLVVPYDEEQLRDAVLKLLDDDRMRQRFSQKGKLLVREKFNWERIVEQMERLYERVIE
jgi:glycosyltransferase involved in cell wall biosynthesis